MLTRFVALSALVATGASAYTATYQPSATGLPKHTEDGQAGTNDCGTESSQSSQCQNAYINSVTDFCLWGPPVRGGVANHEADVVSYCTKSGRGTRVMPEGTIRGVQFVKAPSYVQVTGSGDFTNINIIPNDDGGELDPHGATGVGNPVGGLVFHCENGSCQQMHEWMSFMSTNDFCFRACYDGDRAESLCRHTYDELGCGFNMPADYPSSYFESCESNDAEDIAWYSGSYFAQDMTKTGATVPNPHRAPATSRCSRTDGNALYGTAGYDWGSKTSTSSRSSSTTSSSSTSSSSSMVTSSTSSMPTSTTSTTTNQSQGGSTNDASLAVSSYGGVLFASLSAVVFAAVIAL